MVDGPVSRTPCEEGLVTLEEMQTQNLQSQKTIAYMLGVVCTHQGVFQTLCGRHREYRLRIWLVKPTNTRVISTKEIEVDIDTPQAVFFGRPCGIPPFVGAIIHHPPLIWNVTIPECSDSLVETISSFWESANVSCQSWKETERKELVTVEQGPHHKGKAAMGRGLVHVDKIATFHEKGNIL